MAEKIRPIGISHCGPSPHSSLPFPQLRRHVVIGVRAVLERADHAGQFRQFSSGGHEMNGSPIARASARLQLSRPFALPYSHAILGHIYALAFSEKKSAWLYR